MQLEPVHRLLPPGDPKDDNYENRSNPPAYFQTGRKVVVLGYTDGKGDKEAVNWLTANVFAVGGIAAFRGLGIVLDADDKPAAQKFQRVKETLAKKLPEIPAPSAPGVVTAGPPRFGVFIHPDNAGTGTLEDALLDASKKVYPSVTKDAETFVTAHVASKEIDTSQLRRPSGPKKATLGTVGSLLRPGRGLNVAIEDGEWVSERTMDIPGIRDAAKFLDALLP